MALACSKIFTASKIFQIYAMLILCTTFMCGFFKKKIFSFLLERNNMWEFKNDQI